MNINTFLETFVGDWFSLRTTYHINNNEIDNSKANLTINLLPSNDSQISLLSSQYNLNLDYFLGAIESKWDNSPDWGKPKQEGNSLILIINDEKEENKGKIIRLVKNKTALKGKYILRKDESLSLIIEENNQYIEERISFASENLRLRNIIIKNEDNVIQTSFYSEIRRVIGN